MRKKLKASGYPRNPTVYANKSKILARSYFIRDLANSREQSYVTGIS